MCPNCKENAIRDFGLGTEKLEEEIKKMFPNASIVRMDADTTTKKGSHERIIKQIENREYDIIIGTQMISKGLDFPFVTLVGVINADESLNIPDFRSGERTFSLLCQVAGRAGRDELPGTVVLQTYAPQHPIIRFAATQDYPAFYQYEIEERRKMLYPPFSLFFRVVFSDRNEELCAKTCKDYARSLEHELRHVLGEEGPNDLLLLVAAQAPIARISGYYRQQLLVKLLRTKRLPSAIKAAYSFLQSFRSECESIRMELNPQDMF